MATADQIAAFRLLIGEPQDVEPYTDVELGARIDAALATSTSSDALAYEVWTEKAAKWAQMVDVSEGGSSRKMSDLIDNALKMARMFQDRATSGTIPPGMPTGTRLNRIARA